MIYVETMLATLTTSRVWSLFVLVLVLIITRAIYRQQKATDNRFDITDLFRDFATDRLSRVAFFYMLGAVSSTTMYVYACMAIAKDAGEINLLTITYGGLAIATQGWNKFVERPPDPPAPVVPAAGPGVIVNNQPGAQP